MAGSGEDFKEHELRSDYNIHNLKKDIDEISKRILNMKAQGFKDPFEYEMDIMTNMPDFYSSYSGIVKKICSGGDLNMLYDMLDNLKKVQSGERSLAGAELELGEKNAKLNLYPSLLNNLNENINKVSSNNKEQMYETCVKNLEMIMNVKLFYDPNIFKELENSFKVLFVENLTDKQMNIIKQKIKILTDMLKLKLK